MINGWTSKTIQELDATIRVWFEILANYQIPVSAYEKLYFRAIDTRQTFLNNGKEPPPLNAELLLAGWTGTNGLKNELLEEEIRRGRSLPENAETVCRHCNGSGWRTVADPVNPRYSGVIKCNHKD